MILENKYNFLLQNWTYRVLEILGTSLHHEVVLTAVEEDSCSEA